jgi:hypothetical protein
MLLASQYFRRPPPPHLASVLPSPHNEEASKHGAKLKSAVYSPTTRRTANHVKPSACASENKKRSSAAFGMVAARACTWSANAIPREYARGSIHLLRHGPLARQATQLLQNITGLGVHSLQRNT